MNYHQIKTDDMLNGDGLRVTLFVSGCEHHCPNCQNPQTWPVESGAPFTGDQLDAIRRELAKPYISGVTFSGGDPLHPANRNTVMLVCSTLKEEFPDKTIWLYTGYSAEEALAMKAIHYIDVLVDGKFVQELADVKAHWVGSTNQHVYRCVHKNGGTVLVPYHDSCDLHEQCLKRLSAKEDSVNGPHTTMN